ncbi:hypothetical protein [cyanobacterium endosymbiont of Epithemia clementina EcSB]|uniref:hypothetical protein n=1 Tax=cyanobacterium endosymbiont of Epithemia clementina EcSB TaxID=3034674 RepID=UPI0024812113|nr:hypothetical protein [cyanobacterium endosymbiont of Epithemia clementina EcSB]WGT67223.1 hypothetical protein P3F56_08400 [cyanobacterium endosymbiont of Epithemia clementina EcSB]
MMNNTRHIFALLILLIVSSSPIAQNVSAAPEPFADFYQKNCVPEAQASGLTKEESRKLCNCTVNTLKSKHTFNDFQNLLARYRNRDPKAKEILTSYGTACFDEVLGDLLFED